MSPIKTIIRNLSDQAYNIYWAGKNSFYIPAKGERIVDYEVWSDGDEKRREGVITAAGTGVFELSLLVMSKDGEYVEIPYCPQFAAVKYTPPKVTAPVETVAPVTTRKEEEKPVEIKDDFNVIATSDESRETLAKLGAKPAEEIEREPIPALEFEKKEEVAEEAPAVEEAPVEETKPAKKTRSKK